MAARVVPSAVEGVLERRQLPALSRSRPSSRWVSPAHRLLRAVLQTLWTPSTLFSVFFLGGSCWYLLPLLLNENFFTNQEDSEISHSLNSPLFRFLMCSLTSLPLPLLFELLLDVFESDQQTYFFPRLQLVFVLIIPSILFLLVVYIRRKLRRKVEDTQATVY